MKDHNRIACHLHDGASQTMFAAHLLAGALARAPAIDDKLRQQLLTLEKLHRSALAELRLLAFELHPDALQAARLTELLQQSVDVLASRSDIQASLQLEHGDGPPPAQRMLLYRIAQEALSNIARHSGARHVHVAWVQPVPGRGQLRICDDGCGFDPAARRPGLSGVDLMQARANELGASLRLDSKPDGGTQIELELSWETH